MMASITVRGAANAQALFDVLHGKGVTWHEPFKQQTSHRLTVQHPGDGLKEHLQSLFPEMRFTFKEF